MAIEFFPRFLKHTKGKQFAGKPFHLSPSQQFIIWCVFGWVHKDTNLRRYRRVFITVARKWGKSTFAAGLALLLLFADFPIEPGAEGYVAATKEDQASIVHKQACHMVEANPLLLNQTQLFKNGERYKSMMLTGDRYGKSIFKPIGSDSNTTDGLNPHFVIKDELHAWSAHHKGLKDKLETAMGARDQPLDITISTNGDETSKFYNDDLAASESMLEAVGRGEFHSDRLFAFIAKLDEKRPCSCKGQGDCAKCEDGIIDGDDPFDESNWYKANPDLGVTPSLEYMQDGAERAKREPSFLNNFLRYYCNVSVNSKIKLINSQSWLNGVAEIHWPQAEAVCGAFDLGHRDDLAAVAIAARFMTDGKIKYGVKVQSFCCENGNRNLQDEPWRTWIGDGHMHATEGNTTNIAHVRDVILELKEQHGCPQWRFDPANATQLGQELANEFGCLAVEFHQNHGRYNEPLRDFIKQVKDGNIMHTGDPVLAWAIENAVGNENYKAQMMPDKQKSKDKIDPFVAVVMAFSGVMAGLDVVVPKGDYYESNPFQIGD